MLSIFLRSVVAVVVSVCALANTRGAEVSAKPPATGLRPPERVPEPQLYPASDEPRRAMAKFKIPPGCKVALWAAEPMLGNPVAFCLDEKGNVFTAETYRYRTSALDIRHYMFMLEDDLASRTTADRIAYTKKNFPTDWQKLAIETEVIRRLEDSDGNGTADKSTVYATGMNTLLDGINSGVLAHEGQLWCTNIPNLWVFSGLTAEGAAAKREVLSAGYGVRYSFTGHDLHGLVIGPDGRLYFSFGDRGAHVVTREGKTLAFPDEGAVFRCELDGSNLEVVHRGLRNPQELAFDNHGNLFTGDNDSDQGDRERWVYLVEGGDSGWRVGFQHHPLGKEYNPWLAEQIWEPRNTGRDQPASILSPILNIPDGPSGIVHYPGTGLPPQFAGSFFVCGFKGTSARSAITSLKIKENGAGFVTAQEPAQFVGDVQATDIDFGPDSKIYFSEWGEGWEGTGRGRIFRLEHGAAQSEQAAQIAEVKRLLGEGFAERSSEQLAPLLAHADQRIRLRAQWALAKKSDSAPHLIAAAMKGVDGTEKRLSRLHGIWGMGQKTKGGSHTALGWMEQLLNDPDEEVRAQMIKVLGELRFEPDVTRHTVALLTEALRAPQGRVRFFAAMSLARIFRQSAVKTSATPGRAAALPAAEVIQAVVQLLRQNADTDEYLRHAGVMVLAAIGEVGIRTASDDPFPAVRLAAVLALRQLGNAEVGRFLADSEPRIVKEAARAINDLPIADAYGALARLIEKPTNDRQLMIRVINANYRAGTVETAQALARFTIDVNAAATLRIEALNALGTWAQPLARDRVVGTYRSLPARDATPAATALKSVISQLLTSATKRPPTETREATGPEAGAPNNPAATRAQQSGVAESVSLGLAAIEAIERLQIKEAAPLLHEMMAAKNVPTRLRTRAIQGLATLNDAKLQDAIKVALTDPAPALRVAASTILGRFQPEEAARQLGSAFAEAEIAEKKAVLVALGTLKTEAAYQTLDRLLDDLRANKIPADVRLELLEAAANTQSPVVKTRLAAYESSLPANDPLARFDSTLAGGDAEAGEKLFKEHAVAQCARCHKVKGSGGEAGPDLTDIGAKKDRKYLLESIVIPNAQIAEGFQSQLVTLKNGEMQVGVIKSETAAELTLQTVVPGAAPITLKKADIQARESAPSGMPHGMGELLSKREIRDLVEYLTTLKESP